MNRIVAAVLVSLSLGALPLVANAEGSRPDATLEITGKTFAVGVGFTEATGTLQYQGKSYPVQMKGLSVAQLGVSSIKATAEVYHLNNVARPQWQLRGRVGRVRVGEWPHRDHDEKRQGRRSQDACND